MRKRMAIFQDVQYFAHYFIEIPQLKLLIFQPAKFECDKPFKKVDSD